LRRPSSHEQDSGHTGDCDDPAVTELRVFNLGDGGAMSGILVAGRRAGTADATFLVFLLD
jgi:hypothetical protein